MIALLCLAVLSAVLAIACEERAAGRHAGFYALKPLTTALILAAALLAPQADADYRNALCLGLLLSMAGDVALMFDGPRAFLLGLGSFLLAHAAFVVALLSGVSPAWPPAWTLLPALAALAYFAWLLPRTGALKLPVTIYGAALLAMLFAAALRADLRGDASGLLAVAGALLFIGSDSALALRQFVGRYRRAQLLILASYWGAIGLLALSAAGSAIGS